MRTLALGLLVLNGCTCGGCAAPSVAVDSGATPVAAPPPVVEAKPAQPKEGALPPEVEEGAPSDAELLAAYAADCHHEVDVTYDDMGGPTTNNECRAMFTDQNCAPDVFGCWDGVVACREGCATPCNDCQAACGSSCSDCRAKCDGGACVEACARERLECRRGCLFALQECRATTCEAKFAACTADAEARRAEQCPDCDALSKCLDASKPGDECLKQFPRNASECLEWCGPSF